MTKQIQHFEINATTDAVLLFKVKHFVKSAQQKNWQRADAIFVSMHKDSVIGYARLVPIEPKSYWLRGLFVSPAFRRQGVALKLLKQIHQRLCAQQQSATIFCFPLAHLEQLYRTLDYEDCLISDLPASLAMRFQQAQAEGKNWRLMRLKLGT
ncbi:hypothetical protein THMIRHAS_19750 [Thiosulfatimonas sediminis]|uniref:N-acetyltransferase domain-containing protein n=1 Tax=Thiosulfatimonas sediminis TaxID=2675054 RepID=A0A6F8PWR9_9GAMM|nr:GNAT family N-acetyltransferase [Thiosulfatimonas sediminis]BBP46602.1 hypothetical protein THMIRHAS_19750 [Thiosulfatimonas sediminis]